jgi:hypothetical protein
VNSSMRRGKTGFGSSDLSSERCTVRRISGVIVSVERSLEFTGLPAIGQHKQRSPRQPPMREEFAL